MKLFLAAVVTTVCLASCSKYQYGFLESDLPLDPSQGFTQSKDSIDIRYQFTGVDCPWKIEITNHSSKPVQVDWTKSSIVINDKMASLSPSIASVRLDGISEVSPWWSTTTSHDITGNVFLPRNTTFIPPSTTYNRTLVNVEPDFIKTKGGKKTSFRSYNSVVTAYVTEFDRANTPLTIRSYVTIASGDRIVVFDDTFWLGKVYVGHAVLTSVQNKPDVYRVSVDSEVTTLGNIILGSAVAGAWILSKYE